MLNPGVSSSADITIQGLDKISTYIIKCQGINAAGAGNFSGASNSSQPSSEPSIVRNMVLAYNNSADNVGLKVTYEEPEDNGGYVKLLYLCKCCDSAGGSVCKNSLTMALETNFDNSQISKK